MKKEDIVGALGIGNAVKKVTDDQLCKMASKVSPISGSSPTANEKDESSTMEEKKRKAIAKMKQLLRRAAAARSEIGGKYIRRKVLQLKNKARLRAVPDDDQLNIESPKISFRWEVESCSTTSSAYSGISKSSISSKNLDHATSLPSLTAIAPHSFDFSLVRPGSWITTDTEFVVLEL